MKKNIFFTLAVLAGTTFTALTINPKEATFATCQAANQNPNSDGFIYKGTITLTRVVSGSKETFLLFDRRGVKYVAKSQRGPFYRLSRYMKINNIEYKS